MPDPSSKTFPIIEIFGPTFQGEGSMAGQQTHFVRFGGCDYRCNWCDTPYAVLPDQVKANSTQMTTREIYNEIAHLSGYPKWITFSGGNPLMHDFLELVALLHREGYRVCAETQGSIMVSRLAVQALDLLILSPKPPSSGMTTDLDKLRAIANVQLKHTVKVVVFDRPDFEYAMTIREIFPYSDFWISVGTVQDAAGREEFQIQILEDAEVLAQWILSDDRAHNVSLMPQLHTLLWGSKRGV